MSDLSPGYYEATNDSTPPAYVHVSDEGGLTLRYPSGETHTGRGALILLQSDLLPVCSVEEVPVEETPFDDE